MKKCARGARYHISLPCGHRAAGAASLSWGEWRLFIRGHRNVTKIKKQMVHLLHFRSLGTGFPRARRRTAHPRTVVHHSARTVAMRTVASRWPAGPSAAQRPSVARAGCAAAAGRRSELVHVRRSLSAGGRRPRALASASGVIVENPAKSKHEMHRIQTVI